jgi:hypothetical protein
VEQRDTIMTLITTKITVDSVYTAAKEAQKSILYDIGVSRDTTALQKKIYDFEDTMNGLSGKLQGIDRGLLDNVKIVNAEIVSRGTSRGVTVSLYEGVLPEPGLTVAQAEVQKLGKKLYPLTTSGSIVSTSNTYVGGNAAGGNVATSTVVYDANTAYSYTSNDTIVDPIFAAVDANATVDLTPLATQQNETLPILPDGMILLAQDAAANANGLQAGLTVFTHNPLAQVISDTKSLLLYYTENNYANLNVAIASVYSDPALVVEVNSLKEAIGGGDGLSGAVAQMNIFKDHTDRLSGLVLAEDSPEAEATGDSTDEFLNVNDVNGDLQEIFRFDARKFRSARYTVQGSAANTTRGHQVTELYILHDNEVPYTREILSVYSDSPFLTFTTQLFDGNVIVLANTTAPNTDFVIHGTKLRIARVAESFADMSQQKIITNHETCQAFLNDGIDRVALCSTSLTEGSAAVTFLAREFRDMLVVVENVTGTTARKKAVINGHAFRISDARATIQALIDADYSNFVATRKLVESLSIAENLTISYTDSAGNTIPKTTLNTGTISAIEASINGST